MAKPDLAFAGAGELLQLFRRRRASPVDAVEAALARIDKHNPKLNAFVLVDAAGARAAAEASAKRWAEGEPLGALDGVPVTIKDLMAARGWPTKRGSKLMAEAAPAEDDAPAVARLREAGAIFLGKTTTPEFGWKGVTDSLLTGITRNPWNPVLTPGGSSGGAAVAAATGMGALHLGSDGGGSIRIPASLTGVFGLKPSFGRVPVWPYGPFGTLAHVGPITRSAADAALMLAIIARPDARDPLALPGALETPTLVTGAGLRGLRITFAASYAGNAVEPEVAVAVGKAAARCTELGAHVEPIELPLDGIWKTFQTLWFAGAAALMARFPAARHSDLDPGFRAAAEMAKSTTLADYLAAEAERSEYSSRLSRLLAKHDLLLMPTMPMAAFPVGFDSAPLPDGTPRHDWSPFTYPFNMSGQPAASLPIGLTADHRPIGLQVIGGRGRDLRVLSACAALEDALAMPRPEL
ncbi:MAG: amidase [Alphaproteobacteria bacterium]|nr:amidase [Alphaproteobacteria bacterium]